MEKNLILCHNIKGCCFLIFELQEVMYEAIMGFDFVAYFRNSTTICAE